MNNKNIIETVREIVEEACKSDNNKFGYGIWTHHILVVEEYAVELAEQYGADVEVVRLAALLHDYSGIKNHVYYKEHHIHSAIAAEMLLTRYEYPADKIEMIKDAVLSHRNSKGIIPESKEAICIASADAMAHIKEVPSLLYLAYKEKEMNINDGADFVRDKLEKSWKKVCEEGRIIIQNDYASALSVLG